MVELHSTAIALENTRAKQAPKVFTGLGLMMSTYIYKICAFYLKPEAKPAIVSYNATSNLVRFKSKSIFKYFEKRTGLLRSGVVDVGICSLFVVL
jgi:hypothetical protein